MADRLILELEVAGNDERLIGTVGRPDEAPLAFDGWIGLMSALDRLRRDPEAGGDAVGRTAQGGNAAPSPDSRS